MRFILYVFVLISLTCPAFAKTCQESFQKKGNFVNGAAFSASVQLEGLSMEDAFSQLRLILARDSIKTLSIDTSQGLMKAENPATAFQRALPIDVYASKEGNQLNVEMIFTIPSGVSANTNTVRKYLCDALNQLVQKNSEIHSKKEIVPNK